MFTENEQAVLDEAAAILKNKLTQIRDKAIYSNVTFDVTLEALLESPCLLLPCGAGYQPPTPEQVAFVQHYISLPSEALAHFLGEDITSTPISASGWRRMLDAANLINVQQDVS